MQQAKLPIDGSHGVQYCNTEMQWSFLMIAVSAFVSLMLVGCGSSQAGASLAPTSTPAPAAQDLEGERLFSQNCAACHGDQAHGTKQGPPLVHKIYEPSHHSDAAFVSAVRNGSKQHHWPFGDMPAQPQVTDAQVKAITAYVRVLQKDAGIR